MWPTYWFHLQLSPDPSQRPLEKPQSPEWLPPFLDVSPRPTLLLHLLTFSLWFPSPYLNGSHSVFISQDHAAPLHFMEYAPPHRMASSWSGICSVFDALIQVSICTPSQRPPAPRALMLPASWPFRRGGTERYLLEMFPPHLRKWDTPSILFPQPHLDPSHVVLNVLFTFYLLTFLSP